MDEIILTLDKENFPFVLRQYGPEGTKKVAIDMCRARNQEITETNLYSCLATLETDLTEMFGG